MMSFIEMTCREKEFVALLHICMDVLCIYIANELFIHVYIANKYIQ